MIGTVGWGYMTYVRVSEEETMSPFVAAGGKAAGIEDKEVAGLAIASAVGFAAHPDAVLLLGVDSTNAVC